MDDNVDKTQGIAHRPSGRGRSGVAKRVPRSGQPRTRLDPEVRRGLIIGAATKVLSSNDPSSVTFDQIADEAGVSRALIYNYFGDKSALIAAVYLQAMEALDRRLDESFRRHGHGASAPERMAWVVRTYLEYAEENQDTWRLMGRAEAALHPTVIDNRRDRYMLIASRWGGGPEARMLARGVVGLLEAASLDWIETPELSIDEAAAALETMVWQGLSGLGSYGVTVPSGAS